MFFSFAVDRCNYCDTYAYCEHGHCVCIPGYTGSGIQGDCKKKEGIGESFFLKLKTEEI